MSSARSTPLSTDAPGTPDRWLLLLLVAVDYFLLYAHRSLLGYLKQPLTTDLGLTSDQFGWLGSAWHVPYALAQLGVGYLGDRFPRRAVLLGSLLGSTLAMAGLGIAG